MARQIITGDTIHQAVAEGAAEINLEANAIITDAARELAETKGLRLVRAGAAPDPAATSTPTGAPDPVVAADPVEARVRAQVVAALGGQAPADLDAVIARVLRG